MKLNEIKELFDRIKLHYNVFTFDSNKLSEWHRFLKDYSATEVNQRLDEYLKEDHEQPPLVYSLIRGLNKTVEEPEKIYLMKCEYCGKMMHVGSDMTDFLAHERECMKIDFINRMSLRFRGKPVATAKYYEMSKGELDIAYHKIMNFYLQHKEEEKILKDFPED